MTLSFRGIGFILDVFHTEKIVLKQIGCDGQPSYFPWCLWSFCPQGVQIQHIQTSLLPFQNLWIPQSLHLFFNFPLISQICNLHICFMKIQPYSRKRVMYSLEQEDHVRGELSYMSCLDMMNGCLPSSSQSFPWPSWWIPKLFTDDELLEHHTEMFNKNALVNKSPEICQQCTPMLTLVRFFKC